MVAVRPVAVCGVGCCGGCWPGCLEGCAAAAAAGQVGARAAAPVGRQVQTLPRAALEAVAHNTRSRTGTAARPAARAWRTRETLVILPPYGSASSQQLVAPSEWSWWQPGSRARLRWREVWRGGGGAVPLALSHQALTTLQPSTSTMLP